MKDRELERLLGGYATNTLSEAERKALFNAALDDPELFAALQEEEPLRDLLADAESRTQIERALRQPPAAEAKPRWYALPWAWGLAGTVAAACALVFVFVNQPEPGPSRAPAVVADARPAHFPETPIPALERREAPKLLPGAPLKKRVDVPAQDTVAAPPSPAPAAVAAPQPRAAMMAEGTLAQYSMLAKSAQVSQSFTVLRAGVELPQGDPVEEGDTIQIRVQPVRAGLLSLLRRSDTGTFEPLGPSMAVQPNQAYVLPDTPIQVKGEQSYRLMLAINPPLPSAASARFKTAMAQNETALPEPQRYTDFTLAAGKPLRNQMK